jgi:ethanolamine utilization protein EutJ
MNPELDRRLDAADAAIERPGAAPPGARLRAGVDLGTAYVVVFAVTDDAAPVAGAYRYAEVVRDGVVVDFPGAVAVVRDLKAAVEARLGKRLCAAATTYPPGVGQAEVRATGHVLEAAGLECTAMVAEPTAANAVLGLRDGAVVDVGGGTTGIAVLERGEVVYTADEPTGGRHLSLVVAGAYGVPFETAEARKTDPAWQGELFPVVLPVLEKIGTIVARHVAGRRVETVQLVGGTSAFPGIAEVVSEVAGCAASVPGNPLFVTPLGAALLDPGADGSGQAGGV